MNLGCDQLAIFLRSKGVSPEGVDSVRANGINGDMFLQFCEEDIRDAFTVFKDRFIVRKVIRELKLGVSGKSSTLSSLPSPQPPPPPSQHRSHQQPPRAPEQRPVYQNNVDQHRSFSSYNPASKTQTQTSHGSGQRQLFMPSTDTQRPSFGSGGSQQSINTTSRLSNDSFNNASVKRRLSTDHIKREPPESRMDSTTGVCIDLRPKALDHRPVFSYGSPQLMNATVSSTVEEQRSKGNKMSPLHRQSPGAPYPVCLTQVIPSSSPASPARGQHSPAIKPENGQHMRAVEEPRRQLSPLDQAPHPHSTAIASPHPYDESGSFMLSLVSSSISRFSGDELLGKKPVRGHPTEAQRLGTVLIRNAAQSVRIWDSAPLWKDISQEKREGFMQYVISTAPQLAAYTELVWNRLREALQNRRKYLLDKATGRRVLKSSPLLMMKDDNSIPSINIADVRSLIDLTEQHEQDDAITDDAITDITDDTITDDTKLVNTKLVETVKTEEGTVD
ncbi:uncharacterized protein LOC110441453 [Mizuhopecten yessoensis]|uniref:Uncharacterized protein n=1 Tax=Mizuhopecten yessoensis TaxID=6573 RepID=A0A210PJC3_MIZYE|nr:uncharacterized protein LOC110441453 [Mizuhopecten yessoensis]OWF36598.1 hypothetical protein KP79_PYT03080 [Mizuhopecten yessoensis]